MTSTVRIESLAGKPVKLSLAGLPVGENFKLKGEKTLSNKYWDIFHPPAPALLGPGFPYVSDRRLSGARAPA
jgi:hypothetical protein